MKYTHHALLRMNERNITTTMIEDSIDLFYRYGTWNDRSDRLTLDTASENVHKFIARKTRLINYLKRCMLGSRPSFDNGRQKARFLQLKKLYKLCRRQLKNLKKLEHKKRVTLVICDEWLLTVYRTEKRNMKNTDKRIAEAI